MHKNRSYLTNRILDRGTSATNQANGKFKFTLTHSRSIWKTNAAVLWLRGSKQSAKYFNLMYTRWEYTPHSYCKLRGLRRVISTSPVHTTICAPGPSTCPQVATSLSISCSCNTFCKVMLLATLRLQICYNLLKGLAASLLITRFDLQQACWQLANAFWHRLADNNSLARCLTDLFQLARFCQCEMVSTPPGMRATTYPK